MVSPVRAPDNMKNRITEEPALRLRPREQWDLRKARISLMEVAFACLEGAMSDDPRVTALALALVRRSDWLPAASKPRFALDWHRRQTRFAFGIDAVVMRRNAAVITLARNSATT